MTPRDLSAGPPLTFPDDDLFTRPGDEWGDGGKFNNRMPAGPTRATGYAALSVSDGKPLAIDGWRGRLPMKPPGRA